MTKTNEFRIKEMGKHFIVERKFTGWYAIGGIVPKEKEVWQECKRIDFYWLWIPHKITIAFYSLISAKEFIFNELKSEIKIKEEPIYHTYP